VDVAVELSHGVMSLDSHGMADWICMPYEVVSRVGRGMGVLDGTGYHRWEGAVFKVNAGHPIVANWIVCVWGNNAALPKLLQDFLFIYSLVIQTVQCFDAVGWMAGRASGLLKSE